MKREKFIYNPQTLKFEKHQLTPSQKAVKLSSFLGVALVIGFGIFMLNNYLFPSAKELNLSRQLDQLSFHYQNYTDEYEALMTEVNKIQDKDANVHRIIFGMEPIDSSVWEGGTGGHEAFPFISQEKSTKDMLTSSLEKLEILKRKINLQKSSLDTLEMLALAREEKLASIPSIKPVREDKLKRKMRHLSGYGIRIHPVHKVRKFHRGIDFTAPRGTEVIATGDGKVVKIESRKTGYGKNITINHGHGYKTLYAHLQTIKVKKGDKIERGQVIGTIGSTGTSTAPHLHYEVRINNKPVNPLDYCMDGLSPEEYQELVQKASAENQSFD